MSCMAYLRNVAESSRSTCAWLVVKMQRNADRRVKMAFM